MLLTGLQRAGLSIIQPKHNKKCSIFLPSSDSSSQLPETWSFHAAPSPTHSSSCSAGHLGLDLHDQILFSGSNGLVWLSRLVKQSKLFLYVQHAATPLWSINTASTLKYKQTHTKNKWLCSSNEVGAGQHMMEVLMLFCIISHSCYHFPKPAKTKGIVFLDRTAPFEIPTCFYTPTSYINLNQSVRFQKIYPYSALQSKNMFATQNTGLCPTCVFSTKRRQAEESKAINKSPKHEFIATEATTDPAWAAPA